VNALTSHLMLAAAIDWDPTVRGWLILITAIVILPGSVFLLLSTNVGARLGFLLALTGFFGWMSVQGLVWTVYAQGNKGRQPTWEVKEIITGDVSSSTIEEVQTLPQGWSKLKAGDAILGDAQAAADKVLVPPAPGAVDEHGEAVVEEQPAFEPPYEAELEGASTPYVLVDGYRRGGETYLLTFKHKPHYAVIQVQTPVTSTTLPGAAPPRPKPDTTKPVTSVVMLRDLGSVRLPPFLMMTSCFIIFCVLVSVLHRRDKQIMAERAAATTSA